VSQDIFNKAKKYGCILYEKFRLFPKVTPSNCNPIATQHMKIQGPDGGEAASRERHLSPGASMEEARSTSVGPFPLHLSFLIYVSCEEMNVQVLSPSGF
jgi:hypothetical protein